MTDDFATDQKALLDGARKFFADAHPLFGMLNLRPEAVARGRLEIAATLTDDFRQIDDEPQVHGGVLTVLLDSIFGFSVYTSLDDLKPIATINLRTDYIRLPEVGDEVVCRARTERIRDDVAYVSGDLVARDGELLARGAGAFMIGTRGPKFDAARGGAA